MSLDLNIQKQLDRLTKLVGKQAVMNESEELLVNQLNSMAQLNDRFKTKEFIPNKEIFHISRYKYEFSSVNPKTLNSIELLETKREKLEVIYTCKQAKSTITFTYNIGDGLIQPSKAELEK